MRELVAKARAAEGTPREVDRTIGDLAVIVVQELLELTQLEETRAQERARKLLSRVLHSEQVQRFSTAVTDRFHRPRSAERRLDAFLEVVHRTACLKHLPLLERAQVRAAMSFGKMLPEVTTQAVLNKVRSEADPFLWDADEDEIERLLSERMAAGFSVNLNYVGEEVIGNEESERRLEVYKDLVSRSDLHAVSIKLSGIESQIDLTAFDETLDRLYEKSRQILLASLDRPQGPPLVYFDMEAYRDLSLSEALVHRILRAADLDGTRVGLAVQAYLPESSGLVERLAKTSNLRAWRGGAPLRIRLVKGANLKMEQVEASLHRHALPTFSSKREVDSNFKRTLRQLLVHAARGRLTAGIASHNLFDMAYAWLLTERSGLSRSVQLEMLEGMAGPTGELFRRLSGGLLLYAPAVRRENFSAAVSYLVRRLDENTAPENFIRALPTMSVGDAAFEEQVVRFLEALAESRMPVASTFRTQDRNIHYRGGPPSSGPPSSARGPFDNTPDTDWTRVENRAWIARHKKQTRLLVPEISSILAEQPSHVDARLTHGFDPSRPDHGYPVTLLDQAGVLAAIDSAKRCSFAERPAEARARLLSAVAEALEVRRGELIAAMVYDAGKRVDEADIEVSEAVDFARYYASIARKGLRAPPRGVVTVTPPWNFPLAIPLGGALAALAAGNSVLLKPAPETPWVAHLAVDLCHRAGVPTDALQLVICSEENAAPLIVDPRIKAVVLTGATSTARAFLEMRPGLHLLAETGGKNAAYVSAVADHDLALSETLKSAFGHSGQKCSALSLLILEREVFEDDDFRRKLKDAVESLFVGSAWDPHTRVTPLIRRPTGPLLEIIETGERYGSWLVRPQVSERNPRLVSPGVLWGIEAGSFPHLTEFFGPILSVMCADDFQHGMKLLNQTDYGLTAGLFSLDEREQEDFVRMADAGNLYINRGITGAVVARQPFGGRKASSFGPGAKAGGEDYVHQLTCPRAFVDQDGGDRDTQLKRRAQSYREARREHFGQVKNGTEVVGEQNFTRFTTAPTLLVIHPAASTLDIRSSLLARRLCQVTLPVIVVDTAGAQGALESCQREGETALVLPSSQVVARACELGARRIRFLAPPGAPSGREARDDGLLRAAAEAGISLLRDPVAEDGHIELLPYVLAQSISFAVHRYGNTSLAALSRLRDALDVWTRSI